MANRSDDTIPAPDDDLCLAFADTRYWRGTPTPTDELKNADDLVRWVVTSALVPAKWQRFGRIAGVFEQAIELRETIHRCFSATAAGRAPDEQDLTALNAALSDAPTRQRVGPGGWIIAAPHASAAALLAPVLWSAADLLLGKQLNRVRQCSNPECGWLFLDNSKSSNRRWCSMSACGNRAKAHRHYLRQKGGA
jgi:predicted RNA-binding Zn ribbon-like protein